MNKKKDQDRINKMKSKALEIIATKMINNSELFDQYNKKYKNNPELWEGLVKAIKKL